MPEFADLTPRGRHNLALLADVYPSDRVNPQPSGRHNPLVIGARQGRLVTKFPLPGDLLEEPLPAGSHEERA